MSIFAISDLHLSISSNKPMDIFKGWENYVERLKTNWEQAVKKDDTVVIAGDISWALKLDETKDDLRFIDRLPGEKILIKGNHDLWWSTKKKVENYLKEKGFTTIKILYNSAYPVESMGICICGTRGWFYENNTDQDKKILNREVGRLEASIKEALKTNLQPLVFLHYPPIYNGCECKEMTNVLKKYRIKNCYYGHVHGKDASKKAFIGLHEDINFKFISCDYNDFKPILVK